MEGPGSCRSGSVGYPINSLNVAPRLLETGVFGTSNDELGAGVKPVCSDVNCGPGAITGEANHWDTSSVGEAN